MKNIEKKLKHGYNLQDFFKEFDCSSKEELSEILRKNFSRKTVNAYILRMERNIGKKKKNRLPREEIDELFRSWEEKKNQTELQEETHAKMTTKVKNINKQDELTLKEGVIKKFLSFLFRK